MQTSSQNTRTALPKRRHRVRLLRTNVKRVTSRIPLRFRNAIKGCASGESSWPLTLCGDVGCGKTCAALCVFDWVPDADFFNPNEFPTLDSLADLYADSMSGKLFNDRHRARPAISPTDFWERWHAMNLAGIDDIGERNQASDHRYQTLKRAIDEREGRPLILTTNLGLEAIAKMFDERIASRMAGGTFVQINEPDQRMTSA